MNRLVLLCLLLVGAPSYAQIQSVNAATGNWPPYLLKKEPSGGPLLEKIRAAFAAENIEMTVKWYPWKRAYTLTKGNTADVSFP